MESSHQGRYFKTFLNNIGLLMKKFSYAVYILKIMFVQALCLDAVTICPHFVRMLTTLSFFIWYVEKIYLWNPSVITKVIKLFWFDSVEAESIFWQPKNFISQFVLSVCLSVCLSVHSNTFYSLISGLIWPAKIFMEGSHQGRCFKTFLNNIWLLMKKISYAVYFLKIFSLRVQYYSKRS